MSVRAVEVICLVILVLIPIVAVSIENSDSNERLEERHHSHHDTYVFPPGLSRVMVNSMLFMGMAGVILGLLAIADLFTEAPLVIMAFFVAYLVVGFFIWLVMKRYRVSVWEDRLEVTSLLGEKRSVAFSDITEMRFVPSRLGFQPDVCLYSDGSHVLTIWGMVDVNQILVRINRYEVLRDRG